MSEEEWMVVTGLVNYCRNSGITFAEVEYEGFKAILKADDSGFDLAIEREKL